MTTYHTFGDVHGYVGRLRDRLCDAGIIDDAGHWRGGTDELWFLGDFTDRGPDGIGVIDLVMRLEAEAADAGGRVGAILGNHDVMIAAVQRFGNHPNGSSSGTFMRHWLHNGGQLTDLKRLTPAHSDWLLSRPAIARAGDRLLIHADVLFYRDLGDDVAAVNAAFKEALTSDDPWAWDGLLSRWSGRRAFSDAQSEGPARARAFLAHFGARRLVHGHTPIPAVLDLPAETVTAALFYADGLCVNVDGGMYMGGPGFVHGWQVI